MDYLASFHSAVEEQWDFVLDWFSNNEKVVFTVGSSVVLFLSFCAVNVLFMFLDFTGKPKFLHRYKIQKDKNSPVESHRFIHCARVAFTNELMSCALVFLIYPIMKASGMSCSNPLPPVWKAIAHFLVFMIVDEFIFYYSHRLLHTPPLYKHIHKKHHEWIAPISIAASYAHPLEHLISNFLPLFAGPILVGAHLSVTWLWLAIAQIETCLHHCNYHLPFLSSPQFHDYHHLKFTECFGTNGLLDWFHGTDLNYRKSIQHKRHRTFYGFAPITTRFPSTNKKEN